MTNNDIPPGVGIFVRRVVTGTDPDGKSCVLSDRTCSPIVSPTFSSTELWKTSEAPAQLDLQDDQCDGPFELHPFPRGTTLRFLEFPPDSDKPWFHQTDTIDYIVIIKGEIWCLLEDGDVRLKPGDVLVQRGVNHAWSVRNDEPCHMLAILVDAR
jgi:hypothetical protein